MKIIPFFSLQYNYKHGTISLVTSKTQFKKGKF